MYCLFVCWDGLDCFQTLCGSNRELQCLAPPTRKHWYGWMCHRCVISLMRTHHAPPSQWWPVTVNCTVIFWLMMNPWIHDMLAKCMIRSALSGCPGEETKETQFDRTNKSYTFLHQLFSFPTNLQHVLRCEMVWQESERREIPESFEEVLQGENPDLHFNKPWVEMKVLFQTYSYNNFNISNLLGRS